MQPIINNCGNGDTNAMKSSVRTSATTTEHPGLDATPDRLFGVVPMDLSAITEALVLRISDDGTDGPEALRNHFRTAKRKFSTTRGGQALASMPDEVVDNNAAGREARRAHGLWPVRIKDLAEDAEKPDQLVAYVGQYNSVAVLLVMSTAVKPNLPPAKGVRHNSGRNAYNEAMLEFIELASNLESVTFTRWDRSTREIGFGGQLISKLRGRGVRVGDEHGNRDLSNPVDMMATGFGSTMSDVDAQAFKKKTADGKGNILIGASHSGGHGGWDLATEKLPLGYTQQKRHVNGVTRVVDSSVFPVPDAAPSLKTLAEAAAEGLPFSDIALIAADLGVPLRDGTGRTFADLKSTQSRTNSARRLFSPEFVTLYRTGWIPFRRHSAGALRDIAGIPTHHDGRGLVYIDGQARWGLPLLPGADVPGWGVDDAAWDAVLERATKKQATGLGGGKATAGAHNLFATTPRWLESARTEHSLLHSNGYLQLHARPIGETDRGPVIASTYGIEAVRGVGEKIKAALNGLATGTMKLTLPAGEESEEVRHLRHRLATIKSERHETLTRQDGYEQLALLAAKAEDLEDAHDQRRRSAEARRKAASLENDVTDVLTLIDEELSRPVNGRVDMSDPAVVAGFLCDYQGGLLPPAVHRAVTEMQIPQTTRVSVDAVSGHLVWRSEMSLLLDSGQRCTLPIEGHWRPRAAGSKHSGRALMTDYVEGARIAEIASGFDRTEDWVRHNLRQLLDQHKVSATMHPALVDCPVADVRRLVLGRPSTSLDWYRDRILHRYVTHPTGFPKAWAMVDHIPLRLLLQGLREAGGSADGVVMAEACGLTDREIRAAREGSGQRPAVVEHDGNTLRLIPCPHHDCPDPEGERWASWFIYTPETADMPLLCPACRRRPIEPEVDQRWPETYLQPWTQTSSEGTSRGRDRYTTALVPIPSDRVDTALVQSGYLRKHGARALLDVSPNVFVAMCKRGEITIAATIRGKEFFDPHHLRAAKANHRAATRRAAMPAASFTVGPDTAAEMLGVSAHRVRQYCADGRLESIVTRMGTQGCLRITKRSVEAFVVPAEHRSGLLTTGACADRAGVSQATVRTAIKKGALRACKNGNHFVVAHADLDAWIAGAAA